MNTTELIEFSFYSRIYDTFLKCVQSLHDSDLVYVNWREKEESVDILIMGLIWWQDDSDSYQDDEELRFRLGKVTHFSNDAIRQNDKPVGIVRFYCNGPDLNIYSINGRVSAKFDPVHSICSLKSKRSNTFLRS